MDFDIRKKYWEESYSRGENFIFFPKEEVVKFINRFIRKRIGVNEYKDILSGNALKALDYGCGVGRNTILLKEFGIDAFGVDISEESIKNAKNLASSYPCHLQPQFEVCNGLKIPYQDEFFDFIICDSVLDSMYFDIARKIVKEFERAAKSYVYFSLISSADIDEPKEVVVGSGHESGTIQSYYSFFKIEKLIKGTSFKIIWDELHTSFSNINNYSHGRYHVVLKKIKN